MQNTKRNEEGLSEVSFEIKTYLLENFVAKEWVVHFFLTHSRGRTMPWV
jgi:hypothetical protein